jgi:hypothetical protein
MGRQTEMAVGKSPLHTPSKHDGMWRFVSKESGACLGLARRGELTETFWIDHTAGDGEIAHGDSWERACSPGILIHHQQFQMVPSTTVLYEIDQMTYFRLVANLRSRLALLGLEFNENAHQAWWVGDSPRTGAPMTVVARCEDGRRAEIPDFVSGSSAAISLNDPNGALGWSVRESFAAEFKAQGVWRYRMFSALGFNAAGCKRAPLEQRELSYGHFDAVISALPRWRDLVLIVTKGAHQWAYLVETPKKWAAEGFPGAAKYSFSKDPAAFFEALDRLVLTKTERTARQQLGLFDNEVAL